MSLLAVSERLGLDEREAAAANDLQALARLRDTRRAIVARLERERLRGVSPYPPSRR